MSEIGRYRSRIRVYASNIEEDPSFDILRRAAQAVAEESGGNLTDSVTDSSGRTTACDLAVASPAFPRGVGLKVDRSSGSVAFVYDASGGLRDVAQRVTEEITQNYVSIGLIRAMKALGYRVADESTDRAKTVVLTGVT